MGMHISVQNTLLNNDKIFQLIFQYICQIYYNIFNSRGHCFLECTHKKFQFI